jgi:1,4-dihydroxy-2-naphthoate octaprenyltransferase
VRSLILHLRLPFQLLLAPVFLWGWLVAGGGLIPAVFIGFVSFHLLLYAGVTAFNSYYDRDVGPVGGMAHPPPVDPVLLPFSLVVQGLGWLLAIFVNLQFWVLYAIYACLGAAYSHPRIRLKAHPIGSLIVVGLGQGGIAFLAAWAATRGELRSALGVDGVLGALSAILLIMALFPLSQLFQTEEDAARGDRTLAVTWGPERCFVFAIACTLLGGAAMLTLLARRYGPLDVLVVGLGLVVEVSVLAAWGRQYQVRDVMGTYRRVMLLNVANAAALSAYLVGRLLVGLA